MFESIQAWLRRPGYRVGQTLSRFVATDVRRDVEIMDVSRLDQGFITAQVRTTNVLYQRRGLVPESQFDEAREIAIVDLWQWAGHAWGGLPDGTSLIETHHVSSTRGT